MRWSKRLYRRSCLPAVGYGCTGEVLEELYEASASALAYHFVKAETLLGTEKLVRYSLIAGDQEYARYAFEEARAHFQCGLDGKQGRPINAETAALHAGLGRAQVATIERHEGQMAVDNLVVACDYYVEVGDVQRAVNVVRGPFPTGPYITGIAELLSRILKLVPDDSQEVGQLLPRYNTEL